MSKQIITREKIDKRNFYQELANIFINEVIPRNKKGGSFPEAEWLQGVVILKNRGVINTIQVRKLLDLKMLNIES